MKTALASVSAPGCAKIVTLHAVLLRHVPLHVRCQPSVPDLPAEVVAAQDQLKSFMAAFSAAVACTSGVVDGITASNGKTEPPSPQALVDFIDARLCTRLLHMLLVGNGVIAANSLDAAVVEEAQAMWAMSGGPGNLFPIKPDTAFRFPNNPYDNLGRSGAAPVEPEVLSWSENFKAMHGAGDDEEEPEDWDADSGDEEDEPAAAAEGADSAGLAASQADGISVFRAKSAGNNWAAWTRSRGCLAAMRTAR